MTADSDDNICLIKRFHDDFGKWFQVSKPARAINKRNNCDCCHSELRRCVKVEVAVLGFPSLIVLMVSVDVKQH